MTKAAPAWTQCSITMSVATPHAWRATWSKEKKKKNKNRKKSEKNKKQKTSREELNACTRFQLGAPNGCWRLLAGFDTASWGKGDEFVLREQRHGSVGMPDERIKACVMMTAGCALGPL